jgi:transposase
VALEFHVSRHGGNTFAFLYAVQAAFSLPWSNGQTEGQINRPKYLKRQMYGRAGLALLQARVLHEN